METLEKIIINSNNIIYIDDIDYKKIGYEDIEDLDIDLMFLIETLYKNCKVFYNKNDIKIYAIKEIKKQYSKKTEYKELLEAYNNYIEIFENNSNSSIKYIAKIGSKIINKEIKRRDNILDYHIY